MKIWKFFKTKRLIDKINLVFYALPDQGKKEMIWKFHRMIFENVPNFFDEMTINYDEEIEKGLLPAAIWAGLKWVPKNKVKFNLFLILLKFRKSLI